jgi:hypothetical protein
MVDPGKIEGQKLLEIFQQTMAAKTIMSVTVVRNGFERLTCLTEVFKENGRYYLGVDLPDGLKEAAGAAETCRLRFNFNGPDRLEYIFSTQGGVYLGREMRIPFPEYAERLQRRKNFRMLALPGTRLLFKIDKLHVIIGVINISRGGAYGALLKHNARNVIRSILSVNQQIDGLGIVFPAEQKVPEQVVIIKRAEVRRVEYDPQKELHKYAFEFIEIAGSEKDKLTEYIYFLQRTFLQRR